MLNRNYIFLSISQFSIPASSSEYNVECPKCERHTRSAEFKKDIGVKDGKRTCVNYIDCHHCGIALCFPREDVPPPGEFIEHFLAESIDIRNQRARRAHQFEVANDTRTEKDKDKVKRAIEQGVKEWAAAHNIRGPKFRALRTQALGLMHYGANDDGDMVEPELRTVGDVRRNLDTLLTRITHAKLFLLLKHHDAATSLWTALTQGGQQPIHMDDNILD